MLKRLLIPTLILAAAVPLMAQRPVRAQVRQAIRQRQARIVKQRLNLSQDQRNALKTQRETMRKEMQQLRERRTKMRREMRENFMKSLTDQQRKMMEDRQALRQQRQARRPIRRRPGI